MAATLSQFFYPIEHWWVRGGSWCS